MKKYNVWQKHWRAASFVDKSAFTLAEVLITLAIIGIVAAISIPSAISNVQQQEFKTGLKKAISVLNSAIAINMAEENESPYDNNNLYYYLQRHMSILKSTTKMPYYTYTIRNDGKTNLNYDNAAFYTVDGMRFEFNISYTYDKDETLKLHESDIYACSATHPINLGRERCSGCGSYGLLHNPNNTTKPPCLIMVDVNGDRKPTPANVKCQNATCGTKDNAYIVPLPAEKRLRDIFSIIITEDSARAYGVTAQKAMYESQK